MSLQSKRSEIKVFKKKADYVNEQGIKPKLIKGKKAGKQKDNNIKTTKIKEKLRRILYPAITGITGETRSSVLHSLKSCYQFQNHQK